MIGIIDYGMSNLGSVMNACRHLALPSRLVTKAEDMESCRAIVFPGQGAFGDCMKHLHGHGLVQPLKNWIESDRPFLGICLGLQTLFASSEEAPGVPGLGVLPGSVRRFDAGQGLKIPQIGWNTVRQRKRDCPIFRGVPDNAYAYFVHSYYVACDDADVIAGETTYGVAYASAVWRGSTIAVQFHPEKSQSAGLRMLSNFAEWAEGEARSATRGE